MFLTLGPLQTELAAMVVKELRKDHHIGWLTVSDMPRTGSAPSSLPKDETNDPFTDLFIFYASKALDFPEPVFSSSNKTYCEWLPVVGELTGDNWKCIFHQCQLVYCNRRGLHLSRNATKLK